MRKFNSTFQERFTTGTTTVPPVVQFRNRECDAHWLTKKQVRLLKQLCHPDKHDNSETARVAFEMLDKYPFRE